MIVALHALLAYGAGLLAGVTALEAAYRAWRERPRSRLAERLEVVAVLAVGVTAAGGLGLFVGGDRPADVLHLLYAGLALGALPVGSSLTVRGSLRAQAIGMAAVSLLALALIVRLFQTG